VKTRSSPDENNDMTNTNKTHSSILVFIILLGFLFFYKSWEIWSNDQYELLRLESKLTYFIGRKGLAFTYLFAGIVSVGELIRIALRSNYFKT
jgi:hypothetical protein